MINELVQGFDSDVFCELLNEKFAGTFSPVTKPIPVDKDWPWKNAAQLGVVKTLSGPNDVNMPLVVVAAELPGGEELRERSSRVKQFKFAKNVLDTAISNPAPGIDGLLSQGLFIFHDEYGNFRLSLVYGKPEGTKLAWNAVRRFSFYVEAGAGNKTFQDRVALSWRSFDKLKDAFSVEKLTKEFYSRLFKWYQLALSDEMGVKYPNDTETDKDNREISEHIIRLITRLMFVWFLKQKHLVPDEIFDPGKLKHILKKFDPVSGDNYYRAILQNLFFATLNSEIPERAFAVDAGNIKENKEHFDIKTLYRYGKEFALSEAEVLDLFKGIPFLNGGLFECLDRGRNYYDGFSRNKNKQARLPNRLFFDQDNGLIPLLRQYNFTVEENSPGDEEVALDPELLGKVFENLLAAYKAEPNIKTRNATGSFYTPREIVNYMVDESLIAYLLGKLEPRMDANKRGEKQGTHKDTETHRKDIESIIRELFAEGKRPKDEILCQRMDEALVTAKILDPACGSGAFPMGMLIRMVDALRILRRIPDDDLAYDLKLELIENCIYGADIQCIAVQISKLRFFISLVCEQKKDQSTENYGINPLPNLETKFVAANSLIGLSKPKKKDAQGLSQADMFSEEEDPEIKKLKKDLWDVRHRHFLARSYREKKTLREEDKKLRQLLADTLKQKQGYSADAAQKMADWDPYDQNTSAPFSDSAWMFNVKDGFDIVIGNPPYKILTKNNTNSCYLSFLLEGYGSIKKSSSKNLFIPFIELGVTRLLRPKAVQSYIVPEGLFKTRSYEACKGLMKDNGSVSKIVTFTDYVFENAITGNLIFIYQHNIKVKTETLHFDSEYRLHPLVEEYGDLLTKIQKGTQLLGSIAMLFKGMVVQDRENVLSKAKSRTNPDIFLLGKNITKWAVTSKQYTDYNKLVIIGGTKVRKKHDHCPRILVRRTGDTLCCALLEEAALTESTLYSCWSTTPHVTDKFLLALLNSKLMDFYNKRMFITNQQGFPQVLMSDLKLLPIKREDKPTTYIELVERILATKKSNPTADTSALEAEIDQLVYKLYDLTPEEIAVVEESAGGGGTPDAGRPTAEKGKVGGKRSRRKRKADLPPSLPGWD